MSASTDLGVEAMNQVCKNPLLTYPEILLRGVGQVFFQNNPWTGLIVMAGVAISSCYDPADGVGCVDHAAWG